MAKPRTSIAKSAWVCDLIRNGIVPLSKNISDRVFKKSYHIKHFFFAFFIRQVHAVSPDESSMASPVRLKRYEGFEHGLNVMGRSRGGPYRNKSPPVKKTKRKETIDFGPPSTPNEKNNDRYVFLGKLFFFYLDTPHIACPTMKMNDKKPSK